jgi:aminoglycoside phosphotransferase (APT) family kinase protein
MDLPDPDRRTLTLVPTHDGALYYRDGDGNFWRGYLFIEGAQSYDMVSSPAQAYEAGKAFGQFQRLLADLPSPRLIETIPDFHHTAKRFAALEKAIEADVANRARLAKPEIEFALHQKPMVDVLLDLQQRGDLVEQITHNDTKLNNVLLDNDTGQAICVIDLDTVMPGLTLYDFGDMVRTATCQAAEDERDISKVKMETPIFKALVQGYLEAAGDFLSQTEKDYLVFSGKLITFEMGIRFLADYLSGDTYYKIHRDGHNLDRCRTQFELIRSIEAQEDEMNRIVLEASRI